MEKITFDQVLERIKQTKFDKFDIVIAIGRGGIVPGALVANHLKLDLEILWLNFRDEKNCPKHEKPKLAKDFNLNLKGKKVLLVDDMSKTGATLKKAEEILKQKSNAGDIKTLIVNGKADYSLFDFNECVGFPWDF